MTSAPSGNGRLPLTPNLILLRPLGISELASMNLVILDMRMPDIGGIDLHGKRREMDRRFKVYFISTFAAGEFENSGTGTLSW